MWMAARTSTPPSAWSAMAEAVAVTAAPAVGNTAKMPSPVDFTTMPPSASTADPHRWWRSSMAVAVSSGLASQRFTDPTTSHSTTLRVPDGRVRADTWVAPSTTAALSSLSAGRPGSPESSVPVPVSGPGLRL
ncbi:MAG: hypothetical protein AAFO29_01335, partial [Actinomycetota bacterium]